MACNPPELSRGISNTTSNYSYEDNYDLEDVYDDDTFNESITAETRRSGGVQIFENLEQLGLEQQRRIEEVVECTGLDHGDVFLLLRHYGWDTDAFNEAFFEKPEEARRATGVSDSGQCPTTAAKKVKGLCGICFTDTGVDMMPCESRPVCSGGLTQSHPVYCRDCWQQYVTIAVREGKSCLELRCPTPGCGEAVRPSSVEGLLESDEALKRYRRFKVESFVDDSKGKRRWCPQQGCERAASEPPMGSKEVQCPDPCGMKWCFACGTDAHLPVSCTVVGKWEEKNRDDGECHSWIRVNTKICPKCSNPIEKNGGCMHMTCRKPGGCGYEFCWICMGDWKNHKQCNGENETETEVKSKSDAKSELMRYGHFFERYIEHHKAQAYAGGTQLQCMHDIGCLLCDAHDSLQVIDIKFLKEAVREIRECRRFLKWTYAYAYFSKFSKDQRKLFEYQQAQSEGTLERLSDLMENTSWDSFVGEEAISLKPLYDKREQIITLTGVVHNYFLHFQEAIQNGTLFAGR